MKILWFTWKDPRNPLAGGAEVVGSELARRLVADGHEVTFLVAGFPGAAPEEVRDGYRIIRVGSRYTSYVAAYRYYRQHLRGWADVVIDECNTMPYFTRFYAREPTVMFFHMLCREIWFYQFPFLLALVGYIIEPLYLWLLRSSRVITVSPSTKQDLQRIGFQDGRISIISEGIEYQPVPDLASITKYPDPTWLSLGAMRAMKQTLHQIRAFELAKATHPKLRLIVAGSAEDKYGQRVIQAMTASPYAADMTYRGHVTPAEKLELMQRSHLLLSTSVKEGWGLTVSEAASQGTPAVVYDADGLRDSVRHDQTGLVTATNPAALSEAATGLMEDSARYERLRRAGWEWSRELTFDQAYRDFIKIIC